MKRPTKATVKRGFLATLLVSVLLGVVDRYVSPVLGPIDAVVESLKHSS